jgi:hypothetical protein
MIQLRKTKEWSGEDKDEFFTGTLRLYVGSLLCGTATPIRGSEDLYYFDSVYNCIDVKPQRQRLEDIKLQVELSLKEFASKFCYTNIKS